MELSEEPCQAAGAELTYAAFQEIEAVPIRAHDDYSRWSLGWSQLSFLFRAGPMLK